MRDRRNTHLSTSSTSSTSSADSASTNPARNSLSEKDLERDQHHDELKPRKQRTRRPFLFYRLATTLCISLYLGLCVLRDGVPSSGTGWPWRRLGSTKHITNTFDSTGVVSFVDDAGRDRWTVFVQSNATSLPSAKDYHQICVDAQLLRARPSTLQRLWRPSNENGLFHDSSFMDIDEAQASSILPHIPSLSADVCSSSLTFVMDDEASFGKTLLLLWLSYGFAKREGRAFFLDDSRWAYGRFDSYFAPLPRPGCMPPPPSHILPCPLQARHLVVTASTSSATFDESVHDLFKHQINTPGSKQPAIFDLIRSGYDSTFRLIGEDAIYAQERVQQLQGLAREQNHALIGMQIRRGDLHPFELQFSQDYLPVEKFTEAAKALLDRNTPSMLVLASDDPDIIDSSELQLAASPHALHKSQERIQLATKLALDRTSPSEPIRQPGSAYVKHVDENAGWDGGFYTALFYSLGDSRPREQRLLRRPGREAMSKDTLRMRELIGRGYLLDLAVLNEMDGVVCAVSSAACRILGVMKGHDAIYSGRWLNVDDNRFWSWDGRR